MTLHPDDCTIAFAAYCPACKYRGLEHEGVRAAVNDCTEHNLTHSHRTDAHGFAHVHVVHHHTATVGVIDQ